MNNKITFGESLKFLLETLDISYSKLAKAINVDSSLISLWINKKRVPRYGSSYIYDISEYLSKNVLNTFQEKKLYEFFSKFITENNSTTNYKEKIRTILLESQGFSIESKKLEKNQANLDKDIKKKNKSTQVQMMDYKSRRQDIPAISSIDLSDNDKFISGTKSILNIVTKMLQIASSIEAINNETIYITFNNNFDLLEKHPSLKSLLLNAINKNWRIYFIIRIDKHIKKIKNFIKFITPLIPTGKIFIFYHSKYELYNTSGEIYLVSKTGLLSAFYSNSSSYTDFALYFQNKEVINSFEKYIETISTELNPITFYYESNINEYHNSLTLSITRKSEQYNFNSILNMLLIPEQLYNKLLNSISISKNDRSLTLEYYKIQLENFFTNLQYCKYRDIYFAQKIEEIITNQSMDLFTSSGIAKVKLDVSDIKECLNNIIHIIQTYDNYQVAVIYKDDEYMLHNMFNFSVKDRYTAFYTFFTPEYKIPKVCLTVKEPMVIKAITELYNESWGSLSPMNKDTDETVSWLRNCLDMIQ